MTWSRTPTPGHVFLQLMGCKIGDMSGVAQCGLSRCDKLSCGVSSSTEVSDFLTRTAPHCLAPAAKPLSGASYLKRCRLFGVFPNCVARELRKQRPLWYTVQKKARTPNKALFDARVQ
jgi:hypothetical protein